MDVVLTFVARRNLADSSKEVTLRNRSRRRSTLLHLASRTKKRALNTVWAHVDFNGAEFVDGYANLIGQWINAEAMEGIDHVDRIFKEILGPCL
ncbi:hypothetical protein QJS10_CPB15g01181 [Acorus calamus]|uniref:Uncharacterized protein n=1 Tax=Acorus calamus TaxID=4465 RepID=A0AAV9D719_ACOCL|nr:hypothetical protein QJS10_CPB15g01181 [Acorus calamus]